MPAFSPTAVPHRPAIAATKLVRPRAAFDELPQDSAPYPF